MADAPAYARELSSAERDFLGRSARRDRPLNYGAPTNAEQEKRKAAMQENQVFLRGRFTATGRLVWDVVKIANGEHTLYAKGLLFVEEAAELAVQCMRGRVFVSIGGARALLTAGQHGFAEPLRDVNPLSPRVTLVPQDGRDLPKSRLIEVRPGAQDRPKLIVSER